MKPKTKTRAPRSKGPPLGIERAEWKRLRGGDHNEPHRLLGAHPAVHDGAEGVVVRAFHPDADGVECRLDNGVMVTLAPIAEGGLFAGFVAGARLPLRYRLRFRFPDGNTWQRDDPYRFLPTIGDIDLHLFNEGKHWRLWERLGAHVRRIDGVDGVAFAVWAPSARRVSVVGDFCGWDGRLLPMRQMGSSGVFELFVPRLGPGTLYKYEIKTADGTLRIKTDPLAFATEPPPGNAALIFDSTYQWDDEHWMATRKDRDPLREPMAIYEVHAGSWARVPEEGDRPLNFRELAPKLVAHAQRLGFTHVELLPVAEHPLGASWGYQVTGYYAVTWRWGTPDDFRYFVDCCHQHGVGVILDWVPAHFPRDDFALRWFDGTALYEHDDPRLGEHPDWGTLIFNYGRHEVRNFLVANAVYWLREFHVDGLRVDAVASMLYRDYSRREGEWLPNPYGGRENIEAIEFLRECNEVIRTECAGCFTIAEESTAWSGVTRPVSSWGGLGFTFKWNMGWMHDTLLYFSKEPVHRKYHHHDLTFAMIYEHTERFIMPLSHDEVVHGKGALLSKMPGDLWQQFASLRALLAYQYTRPGKVLLFMGTELAPWYEWDYEWSLDWTLTRYPERAALQRFMEDLGRLYHETPCLWRTDPDPFNYSWIDCHDSDNSVFSYFRREGDNYAVVVLNLTPVPRDGYRIGVPLGGRYVERLNSDAPHYHGSGYPTYKELHTDPIPWQGFPQSLHLNLPPLAALILTPAS
jgi:1,4-alpha-glucan branching enzyme